MSFPQPPAGGCPITEETRVTDSAALLQLQSLDLEILRCVKRLEDLPEKKAILEIRTKLKEVASLREKAEYLSSKLKSDLKAHQDEITTLDEKIAREQATLMQTSDHRAVTSITREMDGLKRRRDKVEMESLGILVRMEKASAQTEKIDSALQQLSGKEASLIKEFRSVGGALQEHIAAEGGKRNAVAAKLPKDLLQKYESARESKGGVGVGELENATCTACRMSLPAERVRALAESSEDIGVCPQCRRLIVVKREGA
jgi:predicted  nucleic acid-binding Zn-ribbon protein